VSPIILNENSGGGLLFLWEVNNCCGAALMRTRFLGGGDVRVGVFRLFGFAFTSAHDSFDVGANCCPQLLAS